MKRLNTLLTLTLIIVLPVSGNLWLRQAQRQYALNRQLIAALVDHDAKRSLTLVEAGADPNTRYNPPPVPSLKLLVNQLLHRSPSTAAYDPTAFMMVCGEVFIPGKDTAAIYDQYRENVPLVQAMLRHGAEVNAQTSEGRTALLGALDMKCIRTAELLLAHGVDVNGQDTNVSTPLMVAAQYSQTEIVRQLLTKGARVNQRDSSGSTELHYALQLYIDKDVIRLLLAHGADPTIMNLDGETPLEIAERRKCPDIVALLQQGGKQRP